MIMKTLKSVEHKMNCFDGPLSKEQNQYSSQYSAGMHGSVVLDSFGGMDWVFSSVNVTSNDGNN